MKKFNLRNKQSIAKIVKDFEAMLTNNYEDAKDTAEATEDCTLRVAKRYKTYSHIPWMVAIFNITTMSGNT